MLGRMEKAKGAAMKGYKTRFHDETTLKDVGVNKLQSHRWHSIAALPKKDFEGYICEHRQGQKEITTAWALKLFKAREKSRPCPRFRLSYRRQGRATILGTAPHFALTCPLQGPKKGPASQSPHYDRKSFSHHRVTGKLSTKVLLMQQSP